MNIVPWPAVVGGGAGAWSVWATHSAWVAVAFGVVSVLALLAGTAERMHARILEHRERIKDLDLRHQADFRRSEIYLITAGRECGLQKALIAKADSRAAMNDLPAALQAVLTDRGRSRRRFPP